MPPFAQLHVAYRGILLAAALLVFGLLFQELVTLLVAILVTVILSIPMSAAAAWFERRGIPRVLGALTALVGGLSVFAALVAIVVPPFVDEADEFVESVPSVALDLEARIGDAFGVEPSEVGQTVQGYLERFTEEPETLIAPLASLGLSIAGILAALVFMLITAFYIAVRPEPLVEGLLAPVHPARRDAAGHVLGRMRAAWVGWLQGVAVDMLVTGVLLYAGLQLIGLEFAIFFAVFSALLVVIPYFGAILGAIPVVLFALADSPGKALLALGVYVLVQQIEGNVIIPLVMSQRVKLHPALIAIGVVIVGQLFGFIGLFVAVPILSAVVILVEELWVHPMERGEGLVPGTATAAPTEEEPEPGEAV